MTSDSGTGPIGLGASRVKALLLLALESPLEQNGWTPMQSAADVSRRLTALGRRVGTEGGGLLEAATAPTTSVPNLVRIKEAAKALLGKAEQGEDREAAV
jgi:hypothetical protein